MALKRKTSALEDIVELTSYETWWVCVVLAIVSFFLLRWFAMPDPIKPVAMEQMGEYAGRLIWKTLANIGQYVLPMIFFAGAVMSAFRRRKRSKLVAAVAVSLDVAALDGMSWREFELLVGEAFRLDGFAVEERGGSSADGGIDLVIRRGTEKFFVQCKQWKAMNVGVNVVRELYGVMAVHGAVGGFVVTSGRFTKDATEFASGCNVILVDGSFLFDMIARAKRVPTSNPAPRRNSLLAAPKCPSCSSDMVERVATRGGGAGKSFWGCSRYPRCKGTRQDP
ncbi:MAG: restriction endonuclease [Aeromicrobium sp.]|nr:restriction endonuclease [Burkholderiales bacterium]